MTANIRGGIAVKPHVQRFADALEVYIGYELSFGTYPGHSPPEGPTQAIDVFNTDDEDGWAQQDRICQFAFMYAKVFGLRYAIRRHKIKNVERLNEGWREQGIQGNRTADHFDHTHFTFYAVAAGTPEIPVIEIGDDGMKVRYIWGPDGLNQTDWVFDAPGRIHATGMTAQVLKGCDLNKIVELGKVDDQTHGWYSNVASGWK